MGNTVDLMGNMMHCLSKDCASTGNVMCTQTLRDLLTSGFMSRTLMAQYHLSDKHHARGQRKHRPYARMFSLLGVKPRHGQTTCVQTHRLEALGAVMYDPGNRCPDECSNGHAHLQHTNALACTLWVHSHNRNCT